MESDVRAKRLTTGLAVVVTLAAVPDFASAYGYNTVPCWRWDGSAYNAVLKNKPRRCTLGGRYGYQQVDLVRMRWRSWGGGSAYGRGISVANMGYRARVRVKLYRPVSWEENTDRFTRARFNFNGQGWGRPLVLRLH
jgi:hypothetical protein